MCASKGSLRPPGNAPRPLSGAILWQGVPRVKSTRPEETMRRAQGWSPLATEPGVGSLIPQGSSLTKGWIQCSRGSLPALQSQDDDDFYLSSTSHHSTSIDSFCSSPWRRSEGHLPALDWVNPMHTGLRLCCSLGGRVSPLYLGQKWLVCG